MAGSRLVWVSPNLETRRDNTAPLRPIRSDRYQTARFRSRRFRPYNASKPSGPSKLCRAPENALAPLLAVL